jgi:hypothetical protein
MTHVRAQEYTNLFSEKAGKGDLEARKSNYMQASRNIQMIRLLSIWDPCSMPATPRSHL